MLLNGEYANAVSLHDRGLAYGDGLFETVLIASGQPVLLERHLARLQRGCERLGLEPELDSLRRELHLLLAAPPAPFYPLPERCVVKLLLTRRAGGRGYRPSSRVAQRLLLLYPAPEDAAGHADTGIEVFLCRQSLARQPSLAGLKHLNRLEQVLASQEWPDDGVQEGLMADTAGLLIEGTRSNVFLRRQGRLLTPDLRRCGIDGVLRQHLLSQWPEPVAVVDVPLAWLEDADEVFVCNSIVGVWPVTGLRLPGGLRRLPIGSAARCASHLFQQVCQHAS